MLFMSTTCAVISVSYLRHNDQSSHHFRLIVSANCGLLTVVRDLSVGAPQINDAVFERCFLGSAPARGIELTPWSEIFHRDEAHIARRQNINTVVQWIALASEDYLVYQDKDDIEDWCMDWVVLEITCPDTRKKPEYCIISNLSKNAIRVLCDDYGILKYHTPAAYE